MKSLESNSRPELGRSEDEAPSGLKKLLQKVLQLCRQDNPTEGPIISGTFNNVPGSPYTRESERFIEEVAPQRLADQNPGNNIHIEVTVKKL